MEPSSLSVGVNESKSVQLTLTPTQTGTFSGSVTLEHNDSSVGTLQVPFLDLTIEPGQFPTIALTQETLPLGDIEVGKTIEKTFTITNGGPGPLNITGIQSTIEGIIFTETTFTVSAGQSKDITATFNPQAEGAVSGTIDVLSNDPSNGTISLTLSGTAIVLLPSIGLAQSNLNLGEVEVGKNVQKIFTITNTGPGNLNVSNIQTTLSGSSISETAFTVGVEESKDITITVTPQAEGAIAGTIDVLSNVTDF